MWSFNKIKIKNLHLKVQEMANLMSEKKSIEFC